MTDWEGVIEASAAPIRAAGFQPPAPPPRKPVRWWIRPFLFVRPNPGGEWWLSCRWVGCHWQRRCQPEHQEEMAADHLRYWHLAKLPASTGGKSSEVKTGVGP